MNQDPIALLEKACAVARVQVEAAAQAPDKQSACAQWNAGQLVGHMVAAQDANAGVLGAMSQGLNPFDPPEFAAADLLSEYDKATDALLTAAREPGTVDRMVVHLAAGEDPIPGAQAMAFPTFDMYIHAWDLAQATGVEMDYPADVTAAVHAICKMAFDGSGAEGIMDAAVEPPADATPIEALVAYCGRNPRP